MPDIQKWQKHNGLLTFSGSHETVATEFPNEGNTNSRTRAKGKQRPQQKQQQRQPFAVIGEEDGKELHN